MTYKCFRYNEENWHVVLVTYQMVYMTPSLKELTGMLKAPFYPAEQGHPLCTRLKHLPTQESNQVALC